MTQTSRRQQSAGPGGKARRQPPRRAGSAGFAALRWLVFALCLLPLAALVRAALQGELGANPIEALERATGEWALRFLLITLAVTPLRKLLGRGWPLRLRRMLGLYTGFYALLHLLCWLWLDQRFDWAAIGSDIAERPYVLVGALAALIMLALALTSPQAAVRRLGRRWQPLHRLIYPMAALVMLHYVWLTKADYLEPAAYLLALLLLFCARLPDLLAGRR